MPVGCVDDSVAGLAVGMSTYPRAHPSIVMDARSHEIHLGKLPDGNGDEDGSTGFGGSIGSPSTVRGTSVFRVFFFKSRCYISCRTMDHVGNADLLYPPVFLHTIDLSNFPHCIIS